ncbi:MAG TPA: DUF1552 domain-containing protein [Polyangia bacterium]|nr:DUF1552 domain-containing protein [Polyangia bacterium]
MRINRRIFLRGLGGAVVAAPFLSSAFERRTKGQTVSKPRQLIVMFTHYGCDTTRFFPAKSHGALEASDLAPTSLAILTPYLGKLLLPRGIRAMNEWTMNNDGVHGLGQGNDPHLQVVGSYFTLQPVTPNSNDPFSFSQDTKFNARPVGSSLDHVMAQQLSPSGTPLFMRVGNSGGTKGESPQSNISWLSRPGAGPSDAADVYPGFGTPAQVFSMLTGLFGAGPPTPDSYAASRGKRVTDLVKADLEALQRLDMSAVDRQKLEAWKALVNDTGATVMSTLCTPDLAATLGATADNANAATAPLVANSGTDLLTRKVTAELDGADMYSVMAVLAAACNYNPVTVLKYPPNYYFSGLGVSGESSNLSTRSNNATLTSPCVPNALDQLQTIDKYYASKLAKLAGMLDGIKNPDGSTLLDSTAAVWFNEMSDGLAMNTNNLPIVQVGGCGGAFKTGWAVNVDTANPGSPTLTSGNSEVQCGPGGTGMNNGLTKETGTDPSLAVAPINKYFCNLMNAMGVKGDVNGYPAPGGTGDVSRFGYSDLTTDFCGGLGAVPTAQIHDPGEFTALKAG